MREHEHSEERQSMWEKISELLPEERRTERVPTSISTLDLRRSIARIEAGKPRDLKAYYIP